jgi:hypothetical protein
MLNSDVSYNIFVNCYQAQGITATDTDTFTYGNNLYWDVNKTAEQASSSFVVMDSGGAGHSGTNNVYGDPRLYDPKNGDYRLLPSSPAPTDNGIPAGAFGYVSAAEAYSTKPTISLDLTGLTRPSDAGVSSLDPDFWDGSHGPNYYVTANPDLPLRMVTSPNFSVGLITNLATQAPAPLHFAGWTVNPPTGITVAAPSQQSTTVSATTGGTVTANWEEAQP